MKKLLLIVCLFLVGCLPEADKQIDVDNIRIVEGELGGQKYYVPEEYFNRMSNRFTDNDILLQTMYPDFLPLSKSPQMLWKEGVWWKNISILVNYYPKSTLSTHDLALSKIKFQKAHEIVGEEYGLIHQKQPAEYVQDHWDLWLYKKNEKRHALFPNAKNY